MRGSHIKRKQEEETWFQVQGGKGEGREGRREDNVPPTVREGSRLVL